LLHASIASAFDRELFRSEKPPNRNSLTSFFYESEFRR
jgi:hypothetical protein